MLYTDVTHNSPLYSLPFISHPSCTAHKLLHRESAHVTGVSGCGVVYKQLQLASKYPYPPSRMHAPVLLVPTSKLHIFTEQYFLSKCPNPVIGPSFPFTPRVCFLLQHTKPNFHLLFQQRRNSGSSFFLCTIKPQEVDEHCNKYLSDCCCNAPRSY